MAGTYVVMTADDGTIQSPEALTAREPYELHSYYPLLQPLTFSSSFLPLPLATAEAWRRAYSGKPLSADEADLVGELEAQLDEQISSLYASSGAFVRLSTRSPKDAADKRDPEIVSAAIAKEMDRAGLLDGRMEVGSPEYDNACLIAVRHALFALMCVHSGKEALDLCANSARVVSDMKRALDHADALGFHMQLILREFVPFSITFELRGFVHNGILTALTQYYTDVYSDILDAAKDDLGPVVDAFFSDQVAPLLASTPALSNCIVDFVVQDIDTILVVELNPFTPETGSGLFDWSEDIEILTAPRSPSSPLPFRVLSSIPSTISSSLLPFRHLLPTP